MNKIKFKLFKKFSNRDVKSFVKIVKQNYSIKHSLTNKFNIIYKYLEYPIQPTYISTINDSKKVKGRICYISSNIIYKRKKIISLIPQDFALNKDYRSPFTNIINLIKIPYSNLSKNFVIHTSNENSDDLYNKILKYPRYFSIEFSCITLNPIFFLINSKTLNRLFLIFYKILFISRDRNIQFKNDFISKKEILDLRKTYENIPRFDRTDLFYKWKFKNSQKYKIIKIYNNDNFLGYIILLHIDYNEKKISMIYDYFIKEECTKKQIKTLIYQAIKESNISSDFLLISGNKNSPIYKMIKIFPFIKLPDKLLPHSSYFYGRSSNRGIKHINKFHHCLIDQDWF
jgi:hypothetical protein